MIQYLKHIEIDKKKWDRCIDNSPNGLIYAYSWYLTIVCQEWDALVDGDYESVMPLPKAEKYTFSYLYPPPLTQQLGVFSLHEITTEKTMEFISAIPLHFRYIEMNLNEKNPIIPDILVSKKLVTYLLDFTRSYSEILSNYSTQTKRNLKKAFSSSLSIVQSARPEKIITLFQENRGMQHELPTAYYSILQKLIETLLEKGLANSIGMNNKFNELCAGAFFIKSKDRDIFLFSGANDNAYETQAMTLLINSYLEENAGKTKWFDFEGSMDKDLARFYSGFGSEMVEYRQIRRNTLPAPVKWLKEMQFREKSA